MPIVTVDDETTTPKNVPVLISVLDNDVAVPGHDLTVTQVTDEAEDGECVVASDGEVLYVPSPGFVGGDSCGYEACDDRGACDEARITVNVTPGPTPSPTPSPTTSSPVTSSPSKDPVSPPTTPQPSPNPTDAPTISLAPTSCDGRKWRFSPQNGGLCTNDDILQIPSNDVVGVDASSSFFAYDLLEQCCLVKSEWSRTASAATFARRRRNRPRCRATVPRGVRSRGSQVRSPLRRRLRMLLRFRPWCPLRTRPDPLRAFTPTPT